MAGTPTTTTPPLPPVADRVPPRVRVAAVGLVIVAIEVVLAASLVQDRFGRFLLLFAAVGGAVVVFRFPAVVALAMLAFTDFIFHPGYFELSFGPLNVAPYEIALAGLLGVALMRPQRVTWGGTPGVALAVFLLFVTVSGVLAVTSGRAPLTDVFNWGRPLGLLTFFYVVVRLFPTPQQRRTLLTGAAVIAAATGLVALLVALGWSAGDSLKGTGTQVVREEEGVGGVQRVRLPGLSLGYALFWYVAFQVTSSAGARRWGWTVILGGIALDIVVSFNRNMWFGLLAGLLLLAVVGGPLVRSRIVLALAIVVAGMGLITAAAGPGGSRLLEPVLERGSTVLNPAEVTRESSYRDRQYETEVAWGAAKDNWLLGVGPGADFGLFIDYRVGEGSFVRGPQLFLHNQYLYLVLIGGVGALLAFLTFLGSVLLRAFRRTPRDPAITACAVGIAMIAMSAVVAIYFTVGDMTVVLALLAGVIVADSEAIAPERLPSGLTP